MSFLAALQIWRDQDHADAITLSRHEIIMILEEAAALRKQVEELREALKNLVRINEEHNEAIAGIIGRPLNWKDDYLDRARAILSRTQAGAPSEGRSG